MMWIEMVDDQPNLGEVTPDRLQRDLNNLVPQVEKALSTMRSAPIPFGTPDANRRNWAKNLEQIERVDLPVLRRVVQRALADPFGQTIPLAAANKDKAANLAQTITKTLEFIAKEQQSYGLEAALVATMRATLQEVTLTTVSILEQTAKAVAEEVGKPLLKSWAFWAIVGVGVLYLFGPAILSGLIARGGSRGSNPSLPPAPRVG